MHVRWQNTDKKSRKFQINGCSVVMNKIPSIEKLIIWFKAKPSKIAIGYSFISILILKFVWKSKISWIANTVKAEQSLMTDSVQFKDLKQCSAGERLYT